MATKTKAEKEAEAKVKKEEAAAKKHEADLKKRGVKEVTVDEAYLEAHPELTAEGVAVGDMIEVPLEGANVGGVAPSPAKAGKIKGDIAILKNGEEYIRTYPEGEDEAVASFLSKDAAYSKVADSSIVSIVVSYTEQEKTEGPSKGVTKHLAKKFSEEANGEDWKAEAVAFKNEHRTACIVKLG